MPDDKAGVTFVLIHGAWHGAWCWYKVVALLEAAGHRVLAPDLPGHGRNGGHVKAATYGAYVAHATDILRAEDQPVVLVGHSMGGAVITGAAETMPEKVARLVYLSAFMAPSGGTMMDEALNRDEDAFTPDILPAGDNATMIAESSLRDFIYQDCSPADVALAKLCLTPQPFEPMMAPVVWTAERYGRIPRLYIGCTQDRVSGSVARQRSRAEAVPGTTCVWLDSSHSPFFSMPEALVKHLTA